LEIIERRTRTLEAARHMRGALCIVLSELFGKFGETTRILELEGNAARAAAIRLRDRRGALALELGRKIARAFVERFGIPPLAARARTGKHQRAHAPGVVERNLQRRVTAHRQANDVRLVDF